MQETNPIENKTIGKIVAENYRISSIFDKHNIDFCCGGKIPLATLCASRGIDLAALVQEIAEAQKAPVGKSENYAGWSLTFLIDYIVNNHHSYVNENTKPLSAYTQKIAAVHGALHPEVVQIAALFDKLTIELTQHLKEEENEFFPAVKRAEAAVKENAKPDAKDLEIIKRSLAQLGREHEEVGDAIHRIRHLANEYEIPQGVCNTFVVTYQKLKEYEDDIHKHVHLENNILFLKAAQLGHC